MPVDSIGATGIRSLFGEICHTHDIETLQRAVWVNHVHLPQSCASNLLQKHDRAVHQVKDVSQVDDESLIACEKHWDQCAVKDHGCISASVEGGESKSDNNHFWYYHS